MIFSQAAADNHLPSFKLITAAGIGRKKSLIGGKKTVHKSGYAPLTAVRMTTKHQIETVPHVLFDTFRSVRQQDSKAAVGIGLTNSRQLLFRRVVVIAVKPNAGVVYAANIEQLAIGGNCCTLALQYIQTIGAEQLKNFCRQGLLAAIFMIAAGVKAGIVP